jgi:hypothetical protein
MVESAEDRATVGALEARWIDERGGTPAPWDEAWIYGHGDGYATFLRVERWTLLRVWLRPDLRRQGVLTAAWPGFREQYGAAFKVWQPSPAMEAFLVRVGHVTGPNTGPSPDSSNKDGGERGL